MRVDYKYEDIINAFHRVGLTEGDSVFVHSNLGFFGMPLGAKSGDDICGLFYNAFKEVLGEGGTLLVPTFSYSFCHGEFYDYRLTKSSCGMFPEYIRKSDGVKRSLDPNFSVAAWGALKDYYTDNPVNESFGKGSFWERLLKKDGKILCMNVDCGSTFFHYAEKYNNVPYRYNKAFNGELRDYLGNRKRDYFVHFVVDLDKPEDAYAPQKLDLLCREKKVCNVADLGKGAMQIVRCRVYLDLITETLKSNPRFFTKGG